ncbi:YdcF family protein [Alteromonas gilva]|uniref:YdcF family protein n=1 Tax=Alteromonas gilva TaxID=2987522 RepID=A0ABT5L3J3_9ALTE|nr:YdcF family protein [Alteromonas gilva]MDC8830348.1 YdcF family protein [Alteromonas gilva]
MKEFIVWLTAPLHLLTFIMGLAALVKLLNNETLARRLVITALTLFIISSQNYVADLLLYPLERFKSDKNYSKPPRYILPLACSYDTELLASNETARYSECSLQRLAQAAILNQQLNVPIIVTGGHFLADDSISYAQVASTYLRALGVPQQSVITVNAGTDTYSELEAAASIIADNVVIAVSSASHHRRLLMIAEDLHIQLLFSAVDYQGRAGLMPYLSLPNRTALEGFQRAMYEYMALLKFHIQSKWNKS